MIQLHLDLHVDPAKEADMLAHFHTAFRPAAQTFTGFVDVKMLKLRGAAVGTPPPGLNYRFWLVYESEELRQKWVTSALHADVWGGMEKTFTSNQYDVLIFDVAP